VPLEIALVATAARRYRPSSLSSNAWREVEDMITTRGMVRAAGVALVIVSGCTLPEYFTVAYWQRDSSGQTTGVGVTRQGGSVGGFLIGSPDAVAQRFTSALAQLGLKPQVSTDMESIRISSMTQSGKQFTIVLKRDGAGGGDHTQVQMEWKGGADSDMEQQLMLMVGGGRR
jgi:hypothetical protein